MSALALALMLTFAPHAAAAYVAVRVGRIVLMLMNGEAT